MSRQGKAVHPRPTRAQIQGELKKSESDFFQPPDNPNRIRSSPLVISLIVVGISLMVLFLLLWLLSGSDLGM